MHSTSLEAMEEFANNYIKIQPSQVLDIGSHDVHGNYNYRSIFTKRNHFYTGVDLEEGENVDEIMEQYNLPFSDNSFDVVISGQTMEHVEDLHKFIVEAARVLRVGGLMCMIAPTSFPFHQHPVDCWRFFPDGMTFLMGKIAGLEVIESKIRIGDCVGIARKV